MPSAPRLDEVTLRRGANTVFEGLSLALVEPRIGLIGDNGAGKSSLLRLLCGLDRPSAGRVRLGERELHGQPPPPGVVGLMFQNPDEQIIFPTVEEELALGPQAAGASRTEARAAAHAALQRRGLTAWAPRAVASLSHGQRQLLCWLALDLAAPRLRLLDEPYASLDLPGVAWLREELRRADAQIIVSSHLLEPLRDFERVLWIEAGRVRADGPGAEVCAAYAADVAARVARGQAGPGARAEV